MNQSELGMKTKALDASRRVLVSKMLGLANWLLAQLFEKESCAVTARPFEFHKRSASVDNEAKLQWLFTLQKNVAMIFHPRLINGQHVIATNFAAAA